MAIRIWSIVATTCVITAGCSGEPPAAPPNEPAAATAAPAPPIAPVISFNRLMVDFIDQVADPIWNAAVTPPQSDAEWEQVEYHAIQLAMTGPLLRLGGTGPMDAEWTASPGWAPFTDKMTEAALAAAQAARNKDVAAIQAAGDQIVLNCEGCHREFKLDLPTEGLATHLARGIITEPEPAPTAAQ